MNPVLNIEGLRHAYGDRVALDGIDLALAPGDFMALIGPNGSGKTTLLRCIAGLLLPQQGCVRIAGIDIAQDLRGARFELGFAVDPTLLPNPLSGRQALLLFAQTRGLTAIPDSTLALAAALNFLPWLERTIEDYSLGTRQKLGILLGLIGEPPVLVLDEPLNGLDPLSAYALKQHLVTLTRDRGAAVLFATHALEVAERFINRAVLLSDGQIAMHWDSAALTELRAHPERSLEDEMIGILRGAPLAAEIR